MRAVARFIFFGVLLIMGCCPALASQSQERVKIVYISRLADIQKHSTQGALSSLATLLKQLRHTSPNVIFIHGGSALGPSTLSFFDKGAHMVGLLNIIEPTAMAVGRRDFVHKEDELTLRAKEAAFPFLCANVNDPLMRSNIEGLEETTMVEVGPYKVGLTTLVSPDLATSFIPDRVQLTGGYDLLPHLATTLREEGADCVIALADFAPSDPVSVFASAPVDMLLVSDPKDTAMQREHTVFYGVFSKETEAVVFDLTFSTETKNGKAVHSVTMERLPDVIKLDTLPPDPEMERSIRRYLASLNSLLSFPVAKVLTELDTSTASIRTRENAFANMLTDALRAYYGSDIALLNAGGIRGNQHYKADMTLTRGDIHTELPLHDVSTLIELDGATLLAALEHGVSRVAEAKGQFLHVSGMRFKFDPKAPVGKRVSNVMVGSVPLQRDKKYTVSTATYLAGGGDGFSMLEKAAHPATIHPAQDIGELLRSFLSTKESVSPQIEGRIIRLE